MKAYSKVVAVLLLVFGAAASESVMAQHVRWGVDIGIPLFWPGYYPPYAYPVPAYAYPAPAYTYPAPAYSYPAPAYSYPAPAMAPAPQQDWYFCPASKGYYPYVRECPSGWQRVPAQPPR